MKETAINVLRKALRKTNGLKSFIVIASVCVIGCGTNSTENPPPSDPDKWYCMQVDYIDDVKSQQVGVHNYKRYCKCEGKESDYCIEHGQY